MRIFPSSARNGALPYVQSVSESVFIGIIEIYFECEGVAFIKTLLFYQHALPLNAKTAHVLMGFHLS